MEKVFLLIDDDADDLELFSEAVEEVDADISCFVSSNGNEAFESIKKIKLPTLILLDINMPKMSGWECLEKFKSEDYYKNIPVIMYSTSSNQKDIDAAIKLGALSYLIKPNDYQDLKKLLKVIIDKINAGELESIPKIVG